MLLGLAQYGSREWDMGQGLLKVAHMGLLLCPFMLYRCYCTQAEKNGFTPSSHLGRTSNHVYLFRVLLLFGKRSWMT